MHYYNNTITGRGHDLGSINIQRGRDHGIPGYNEFRKMANLPPITDHQPPAEINGDKWADLMRAYDGRIDDIDLYPAGLAENPLPGR